MNKASLVLLYVAHTPCAMPQPTRCSKAVWRCRVRRLWLKIISISIHQGQELVSDSISAFEVPISMWLRLCTHYINDHLPYYKPLCSYWACGQVFHNNNIIIVHLSLLHGNKVGIFTEWIAYMLLSFTAVDIVRCTPFHPSGIINPLQTYFESQGGSISYVCLTLMLFCG